MTVEAEVAVAVTPTQAQNPLVRNRKISRERRNRRKPSG